MKAIAKQIAALNPRFYKVDLVEAMLNTLQPREYRLVDIITQYYWFIRTKDNPETLFTNSRVVSSEVFSEGNIDETKSR